MLEYRHVSACRGGRQILTDISLSFPPGRITALLGPNGSGKTTLLQCLNGMASVRAGQILLNGRDLLSLSPRARALQIAILPQIRSLVPSLPVRILVEHGRFPALGFTRRMTETDRAIVHRAMEEAGVLSFANTPADRLSGGMRQRAFLAMALAQDAAYLILDEPTTYLDAPARRDLLALLLRLRSQGKTIVLVLHDLNEALRIADQLAILKEGRLFAAGSPAACLESHALEEVFQVQCRRFEEQGQAYYFFD